MNGFFEQVQGQFVRNLASWMLLAGGGVGYCVGQTTESPSPSAEEPRVATGNAAAWAPPEGPRRVAPVASSAPSTPGSRLVWVRFLPIVSTQETAVVSRTPVQTLRTELRDPFWPAGYVPPQSVAPGQTGRAHPLRISDLEWEEAEKQLVFKGVSRIPTHDGSSGMCALINGKLFRVGEAVVASRNGKTLQWRVVEVSLKTGATLARVAPTPTPGR